MRLVSVLSSFHHSKRRLTSPVVLRQLYITTHALVLLVLLANILTLVSILTLTPVVCSPLTECCVGCHPEHLHSSGAGASGECSCSALPRGGGVGQSAATGAGWSATRRTVPHSSKRLKVSASG